MPALRLQPGQTRRGNVVLGARRYGRGIVGVIVVGLEAKIVRDHQIIPLSRAKRANSGQYFVIMLQFGGFGPI
jgi:hypothetical protein